MCFAFFCKTVDLIRKYFPVVKKTCEKSLDIESDVLHLGKSWLWPGSENNKTLLEVVIMWTKPTAIEMSCGCEINMYAPAEGDRPLF